MARPNSERPGVPQREGSSATAPGQAPTEDTIEGCRHRAEADLKSAATMDTENGRVRMERSARSWAARATLLEGEGLEAHRSILRAEWDAGERPLPRRGPEPSDAEPRKDVDPEEP